MFDSYKTFLKADVMYMRNRHALEEWLFVNFLAMLGYYKLYDRLRKAGLLSKESRRTLLNWQNQSIRSGYMANGTGAG
jgi:hypothetical protein